jgi:predicted enzyme related to lactoylglutathione lyase
MLLRSPRNAFSAFAAAAAIAILLLPALLSPPEARAEERKPLPGKFIWNELLTEDVAAAQKFYGDLLGWTFDPEKGSNPPYFLARLAGAPVAGIVSVKHLRKESPLSQWLSYASVADVDQAVAAAKKLGATVHREPFEREGIARVGVFSDPFGALIGVAKQKKGDPVDARPPVGAFLWEEYLAADPAKAIDFYRAVLPWEAALHEGQGGINRPYWTLKAAGVARAGLYLTPFEKVAPNWLPYIRVADPTVMAAKAASLGGKVAFVPRPEVRGGTLAVIVDPTGAAVALQKWPLTEAGSK